MNLLLPELGYFALLLAMMFALFQTIQVFIKPTIFDHHVKAIKYTTLGQLFFIGIAFIILAISLVSNNFSVAYVSAHSNLTLPLLYRFCALWASHAGSLLLWILILSAWTAVFVLLSKQKQRRMVALVASVLGVLSLGFYGFLLVTANPFQRILPAVPLNGADLNPVLQDPGLAIHPPLLYLGYVGFSIAFALAVVALIEGKIGKDWIRVARLWVQIPWCFLTLGIVLGSWWSYRELGWGGWWFWDPVENASFLPWLSATALLHAISVTSKTGQLKRWVILLCITTFSISLVGTFLVRSGLLTSIHAFALDAKRDEFLLIFLLLVVGAIFTLYAVKSHQINSKPIKIKFSMTFLMSMNSVLIFLLLVSILFGTLYPLVMKLWFDSIQSVGVDYFNKIMIFFMFPILALMGFQGFLNQQKAEKKWIIVSIISAVLLLFLIYFSLLITGALLAVWVIITTVIFSIKQPNIFRNLGMIFAHIGVGVVTFSIILSAAFSQHKMVVIKPGANASLGDYRFHFQDYKGVKAPNYLAIEATIDAYKNRTLIAKLHPQIREFLGEQIATIKPAIKVTPFYDLYVAVNAIKKNKYWTVLLAYKPFVRWIWVGGLLMVLGGLCSCLSRRKTNYSASVNDIFSGAPTIGQSRTKK